MASKKIYRHSSSILDKQYDCIIHCAGLDQKRTRRTGIEFYLFFSSPYSIALITLSPLSPTFTFLLARPLRISISIYTTRFESCSKSQGNGASPDHRFSVGFYEHERHSALV